MSFPVFPWLGCNITARIHAGDQTCSAAVVMLTLTLRALAYLPHDFIPSSRDIFGAYYVIFLGESLNSLELSPLWLHEQTVILHDKPCFSNNPLSLQLFSASLTSNTHKRKLFFSAPAIEMQLTKPCHFLCLVFSRSDSIHLIYSMLRVMFPLLVFFSFYPLILQLLFVNTRPSDTDIKADHSRTFSRQSHGDLSFFPSVSYCRTIMQHHAVARSSACKLWLYPVAGRSLDKAL